MSKRTDISPVHLIAVMLCGIIITAVGIHLNMSHDYATGPSRFGGNSTYQNVAISGTAAIIFGIILTAPMVFILLRQMKHAKTDHHDDFA